jgi:NAD(P)-dependent dehydrogenase (short-subunit alcohol dehydrogenase family)
VVACYDKLPDGKGGYQAYKAAGKLQGKKAIITGGDSGIGRATAILFAMEGADSLIAYLPDEQKDAEDTKRIVEEKGQKCHLFPTDLTDRNNCQRVVDEALKSMGTIDILFNNHAYQMMTDDIFDLSEYARPQKIWDRCRRLLTSSQGSMATYIQHQYPPLFLSLQIRAATHEQRIRHH